MALLECPHWEAVPLSVRDLLAGIGQQPFASRFYLAGGTALALQLGHRVSVDLDFFSDVNEVGDAARREIVSRLAARWPVERLEDTFGNLLLSVADVHIGFFSYGYPLLESTLEVLKVRVASLMDIGMMKLDALISRGARKDFIDLYFIAQHIQLEDLLRRGPEKYPYARDYEMMALVTMTDFSNADRDAAVETLIPVEWDEIKRFFVTEAQQLGSAWFGLR